MATNLLRSIKKRPRYALAFLVVGACSYATDGSFFSGVMGSKWIGLPQYEEAMKELQKQCVNWGVAALTLGIAAFALTLPHWPARSTNETTHDTLLTASPEGNIWIGYFGQCALRAGGILFGTFALAVMIPLAARLFYLLFR